jgi:cytochrome c oxidase subunit III
VVFEFTFGTVMFLHKYGGGWFLTKLVVVLIIFVMFVWWRVVIREAMYEDKHNHRVQRGLRLGVALFIVSEAMFFFSFFGLFFISAALLVSTPKLFGLLGPLKCQGLMG